MSKHTDLLELYSCRAPDSKIPHIKILRKYFSLCESPLEANVLGYLIDKAKTESEQNPEQFQRRNFWFRAREKEIQECFCISEHLQTKAIKSLKEKNFIEIKYEGIPQRRWIKIEDSLTSKLKSKN